ncbi:hypothetical protein [Sphingomonas faeni]|uniref:hypothetical protein n=1 Tax=Sphingomonas faeni TaxID=185950 RepID=UPI002787E2D5|nr:hypothetical protein [Sphingomonas faeni]MDQ0837981.1 hypothetical protein [Sphingomonas faeni]
MSVLIKIDRYLRQTGMPMTKFGRLSVGDPRLVHDLRLGRQPRAPMVARIETFIDQYGIVQYGIDRHKS